MKILYLDVCTLCRPFDDQQQLRIRMETDALYLIVRHIEAGRYRAAVSPVHYYEVGAIREREERTEIRALLQRIELPLIDYDQNAARARAMAFHTAGMGAADAAHVAFAEQMADFFITCDDNLLKRCRRIGLSVVVTNPIEFVANEVPQ
jgi:predicted nucleic acid-binding protein